MDDELKSLKDNATYSEPCELPKGTKWVLKVKRNERGEIERYKSRLVAKGFLQKEGRDYKKTFAPVMQTALLRSMLALATKHDWEIEHVDIKTAFLYGEIDRELYIQLSNGSCRLLHKGIYGLKQAGRLWNKKFNATLISLGFLRCENDPCCYVLKDKSMIVMVHVDDCIILGPDKKRIQQFKTGLENEYEIKDLGPVLGDRTHRHKNRFPLRRN